jgi:hypothetical protein
VGHSTDYSKRKLITVSAYIKKTETTQTNNLTIHLKFPNKQEQIKPKTNRWREIIKIRAKMNKIKNKQTRKESMKQKS